MLRMLPRSRFLLCYTLVLPERALQHVDWAQTDMIQSAEATIQPLHTPGRPSARGSLRHLIISMMTRPSPMPPTSLNIESPKPTSLQMHTYHISAGWQAPHSISAADLSLSQQRPSCELALLTSMTSGRPILANRCSARPTDKVQG